MPEPQLPNNDEVLAERLVAQAIADLFRTIDNTPNVHMTPQYPDDKIEAAAISSWPDPVLGANHQITNVIEIGLPSVSEDAWTSEECTNLVFTYPISFSLGVVNRWEKDGFPYKSSAEMAIGQYMKWRRVFKGSRQLGYDNNVVHYYLQLESVDEITNDKGEATEHLLDMTLAVSVKGKF